MQIVYTVLYIYICNIYRRLLASIPPIGSGNHFPSNFIPQILFPQKSFSQMRYFPDTVLLSGRYKDFRKILFLKILFVKQTFQKNFSLKSHFPYRILKNCSLKNSFTQATSKKLSCPRRNLTQSSSMKRETHAFRASANLLPLFSFQKLFQEIFSGDCIRLRFPRETAERTHLFCPVLHPTTFALVRVRRLY